MCYYLFMANTKKMKYLLIGGVDEVLDEGEFANDEQAIEYFRDLALEDPRVSLYVTRQVPVARLSTDEVTVTRLPGHDGSTPKKGKK